SWFGQDGWSEPVSVCPAPGGLVLLFGYGPSLPPAHVHAGRGTPDHVGGLGYLRRRQDADARCFWHAATAATFQQRRWRARGAVTPTSAVAATPRSWRPSTMVTGLLGCQAREGLSCVGSGERSRA